MKFLVIAILFFLLLPFSFSVDVPQGCQKTVSETGIEQVDCDFSASQETFKEFSVKEQAQECQGKFEMLDGKPTCIKEGTTDLVGTVCPTEAELAVAKSSCKQKIEEFIDEKNCKAIKCINEEFAEKFEQKIKETFSGMQEEAVLCEKNGGELVIVNDKPLCVGKPVADLAVKQNLSPMNEPEINATANKIEKIDTLLESASQKLEALEKDSSQAGNAVLIQETKKTIESLEKKLEATKTTLATTIEMTPKQKVELISDLHSIKKDLSLAAFGIAKGEIITDEAELKKKFETYSEYYGRPFTEEELKSNIEKEKGAHEKIRSCDSYPQGTSFDPPDPDGYVTDLHLKPVNGKCEIVITTKMGKTAKYLLEKQDYVSFTGPEAMANVACEGEACEFLKQLITQPHGDSPEAICTEKCVYKDCSLGHYACMQQNLSKCEVECGLKKQGEGPFDSKGNFDPMQACTMMCAGDESMQCKPGGTNSVCNSCETKCIKAYGPGHDYEKCVTEEKLIAQKAVCEAAGQYAEPIEEQVMEKTCITGVVCRDYPEKEEDSGTGPNNYEPGHEPENNNPMPTGNISLYNGFIDFIKGLVNWK